jgi:phenylalanyl-tRNA synthetase beta chain
MKISVNWLRRLVEVDWDAAEIARRLTLSGLEVEEVESRSTPLPGVVVARVLEAWRHPNADKLQLARVDTGTEQLTVVCGAPNCRPGLTVALATPGAVLPGDFVIKKAKIRGEESFGMLCSERELGLSAESDGILELESGLAPGMALTTALALEDTVLHTSPTANRGDMLSHLGVAREVAALAGVALRPPPTEIPAVAGDDAVSVEIADAERCARYVGRVVRGLRVGPSPLWVRRLLESVGVRAINNLVDVTNFVLMELGQPLHAFDLRDLRGPRIVVRRAVSGERMTTLDGIERTCIEDDLLICDAERPVALAGVMGGLDSEVKADTTDVFLESAWFLPTGVRATSRRLGLRSDSSQRFERGVDPLATRAAADRAVRLMIELSASGSSPRASSVVTDRVAREVPRALVRYAPAQAERLLGVAIDAGTQRVALGRLGFEVDVPPADGPDPRWSVRAPGWRPDVAESADLVEEVARFVGFDAIPTPPARLTFATGEGLARDKRIRQLRRGLATRGFHQALNYPFLSTELLAPFGGPPPLALQNPLSEDLRVLRTSMLPRLVANAAHNERHGQLDFGAFEIGRVFLPGPAAGEMPTEIERLGLVWGGQTSGHWSGGRRPVDFFDLKGEVERVVRQCRPDVALTFEALSTTVWLHPGVAATVRLDGRSIGVVGQLHPRLGRTLGLGGPLFVAELDLGPLVDTAPAVVRFADFQRLPAVRRDVALQLPKGTRAADVLNAVAGLGVQVIDNVEIFDVYEGESVGAGHFSLGLTITYRAPDRTLTDDEVSATQSALVGHLVERFGGVQR